MIRPVLSAAFIAAAFIISLFFEGAQSYLYAPGLLFLLAGLLLAAFPSLIRHPPAPSGGSIIGESPIETKTGHSDYRSSACAEDDGRKCSATVIPVSGPILLLFAFWIYTTLSLLWSLTPFPSLVTYLVLSCLPLTFFALLLSPDKARFTRTAQLALLAALTLLGAWAVLQTTVFADQFGGRAGHPLLNANNLAALMTMGLLPALGLALTARDKRSFYSATLPTLILFGGLTATQSRGGILCCFLMIAFLLFILRDGIDAHYKRIALLAGLMTIVFFTLSLPAPGHGAAGRLALLAGASQDQDVMNRPVLWRATLGMIAERPLTGTGLGSFYMAYSSHRPVADTRSAGQWAHNDPLQFAAEMGIAAPLLFYAFVASLAFAHWRFLRHEKDNVRRTTATGPLLGFMSVVLHSHVEFQLYVMPILIVSGVWLAVWAARTMESSDWRPLRLPAGRITYPVLLLAVVMLFAVPAIRCGAATYYLVHAIQEMGKGRPATFARLLEQSDRWGPDSFIDAKVQRTGLYIDLLRNPDALFTRSQQKDMAADVLSTLDAAGRIVPFWGEIDNKRAALYVAMKDRLDPDWKGRAEMSLRTALRKNPLDLKARARLIDMLMARGQAEEALTLLQEGLRRPHPPSDQKNMLALAEKLQNMVALKKRYESSHTP